MDDGELLALDLKNGNDAEQTGLIIWNYYKVLCVLSEKGDIKIVESKTLDSVIARLLLECFAI